MGVPVEEEVAHHRSGSQQRDSRVEIGDIHPLPTPALLPCQQGQQNTHRTVHGGARIVGNNIERNSRGPIRLTNQIEHSTNREVVNIVRREVPVRTILSKATERAINQAGIDLTQRGIVPPQPCHDPRSKTFYQDVCICRQLVENLLACRMFQVNGNTPLITIDKLKSSTSGLLRRLSSTSLRRLCWWGFDFQHFGTHIGQHHRTKGARGYADEFKNFYPLQWAWHRYSSPLRSLHRPCVTLISLRECS